MRPRAGSTTETRQVCWSHLERDFRKISERDGPSARLGWKLLRAAQAVFKLQKKWLRGRLEQENYEYTMGRHRMHLQELLRQGASMDTGRGEQSPTSKTKGTCRELLAIEPALWTFASCAGIELTNNFAERQLRHAVKSVRGRYGMDVEAADGRDDNPVTRPQPARIPRRVGPGRPSKSTAAVASARKS